MSTLSLKRKLKKSVASATPKKKKFTHFKPVVLTRHHSHEPFKEGLGLLPFRSIVRLGSTTTTAHVYASRPNIVQSRVIECNSVQSIKNSANKLLMKQCFTDAGVKTADWFTPNNHTFIREWAENKFPIVAKHHYGSRGTGNYLLKTEVELESFLNSRSNDNLNDYIYEKFMNFTREYRLHMTKEGCFYTCRKMLKEDTPDNQRWFRNDSNCLWYMEDNEGFNKPSNWSTIEADCVKALNSLGLDIGCFDVKVQSETNAEGRNRKEVQYIVIESGSAPSFGDVTTQKYLAEVPKVLKSKYTSTINF